MPGLTHCPKHSKLRIGPHFPWKGSPSCVNCSRIVRFVPQNTRNRESDCALCRKGSLHPHIAAGSCVSYHHPKPRIILQFRIGNPESDCTLRGTCLHAGGLCVSNHPRPRIGPRFDCGILCRKGSLPVTDCAFRTQKQQNCSCIVCFVP